MAVGGKKCHAVRHAPTSSTCADQEQTLAERRRRHNALGYTDCEHCDVRFKDLRELVPHRRKYHAGEERKAHAKEQAMCNAKRRAAAAQAHRPAASPNTTTTASSPVASTSRLPTAPTSRGPAAFSLYDDDCAWCTRSRCGGMLTDVLRRRLDRLGVTASCLGFLRIPSPGPATTPPRPTERPRTLHALSPFLEPAAWNARTSSPLRRRKGCSARGCGSGGGPVRALRSWW